MKRIITLVFAIILAASISFAAEKSAAPAKPAAPAVEKKVAPAAKAELIDINTATEAELKAIPGIGDAYSKKIIAGRPYAKKDQIKKAIPKATYEKIKDLIIAKQAKK